MTYNKYNLFYILGIHLIVAQKKPFLSEKSIILFFILSIFLCSPVVGTGFWLSLQAIERGDSFSNRCNRYILYGLIGADLKHNQSEYKIWRQNFINHIYDKNEHLTKYLCENVSISTLTSILAILLNIILNIVIILSHLSAFFIQ